jgi:hypothetical protein
MAERILHYFLFGVFFLVALVIVFVRAGAHGGANGAQQTSQILQTAGGQVVNITKAIASIGQ